MAQVAAPFRSLSPAIWRRAPEGIAAFFALVAAAVVGRPGGGGGFPVDDAWIHMVYGLELARDHVLAYNDGVSATGATSPLWAGVAALAHLVVGARAPSMAAATTLKVFSALSHAAASVLAARCARLASASARLAPALGCAAGVLVATCPLLAYAAVSGMEASLAGALLLAVLVAAARGRTVVAGVALGLAFLARPECAVGAPGVLVLLVLRAPQKGTGLARGALALVLAASFAAVLFARNQIVSGRPLPATFYAKAAPVYGKLMLEIRLERGFGDVLGGVAPTSSRLLWTLVALALVVLVAAGARVAVRGEHLGRRGRAAFLGGLVAVTGVGYAALVAWIVRVAQPDVFYFQRYFAPAIPLLIVGATSGASAAAALVSKALLALGQRALLRFGPALVFVLAAGGVIAEASRFGEMARRYASDVRDIDAVQVALGRFIAGAIPPGGTVWSMDAGAVRYWGGRFVVDLGKLNTPDLVVAGEVRPEYAADAIVVLDTPPVRVVAGDGMLEAIDDVRAPSWPPPPEAPAHTQTVWRCRAGSSDRDLRVEILGYPDKRAGRCKGR